MEIWKDVEGYEGRYQVSSLGNVKSLSRLVGGKPGRGGSKKINERVLKFGVGKTGYLSVSLRDGSSSKGCYVHRLVAQAFIPNPENKPTVNHKNGIKSDNAAHNLEWSTFSENTQHGYKTGLLKCKKGEYATNVKLTASQAVEIKYGHKGLLQREIAEIYGINKRTVGAIRQEKIWKHI